MSLISRTDADRIAAAIADAESRTSGEIVAVITPASSSYLYVPFLWAALGALLVPWPLIHFTWMQVQHIYLIQLAAFAALLLALWPMRARTAFLPRSVLRAHVARRAVEQFLTQNLHTTAGRTGVLIFVSIAERQAQVLADKEINAKVAPGTWQDIVERMTARIGEGKPADGFISAIEGAGTHLARHFPPGSADLNELPNHLIVLEE